MSCPSNVVICYTKYIFMQLHATIILIKKPNEKHLFRTKMKTSCHLNIYVFTEAGDAEQLMNSQFNVQWSSLLFSPASTAKSFG